MDTIEFLKVSVAEAKASMNDEPAEAKSGEIWESKRNPEISLDLKLQQLAREWILSLPDEVRPLRLARKFPRVANKIAHVWQQPSACDKVMHELLIDHRGTRQGFPPEVAMEIASLKAYYTTKVYVLHNDIWTLA